MINLRCVKSYCCEDISLIENYDKAINDTTQKWDCHHRLEIDMNLSYKELKESGLYLNRPASELIFLTHSEHQRIHKTCQNPMTGKTGILCPNYGRSPSEETKQKTSESMKKYWAQKREQVN